MKIEIEYESSWRNSFLEDTDGNNKPLPKNGRKFIASGRNLNSSTQPENFIKRDVTIDTVMGVLNRLIGDQRKLYQSRQDQRYYFRQIEPFVAFEDRATVTNEVTYIRNITGSTDQHSFTGMVKDQDAIFQSEYSPEFWGVLALTFDELCAYIINNNKVEASIGLDPLAICERFDELAKIKPVEKEGIYEEAIDILDTRFPETGYLNNAGKVKPSRVYCSALYLQLERLKEREFGMTYTLTQSGTIPGISKANFTKKDFMDRFTTGPKKLVWGNPYLRKIRVAGEGEIVSMMTKASGQLEITIDVDREKAKEIKTLIENAGVSSFYLGKKGLAYVTNIDTREVRQ
ncbi:MAG: type I-Fv CRISPR-associated protein Cas5fv [Thermodesulfobacteriota bacterium]